MSVPKRFKTKTQQKYIALTPKVFTRGATFHLLDRDLLFIDTVKIKKFKGHRLNYVIK